MAKYAQEEGLFSHQYLRTWTRHCLLSADLHVYRHLNVPSTTIRPKVTVSIASFTVGATAPRVTIGCGVMRPSGRPLIDNFPEIDKVVQFSGRSDILLTNGDKMYQEDGVFFMDSTAFDVFSWKLLEGNPKTALSSTFQHRTHRNDCKQVLRRRRSAWQITEGQ